MNEDLLRCLLHVIGRVAIPADQIRAVIGTGESRIKAFNMCDGTNTLAQIVTETEIDKGNLTRAAQSWIQNGIAFWVGKGQEARLLHIYSIPENEHRRKTVGKK